MLPFTPPFLDDQAIVQNGAEAGLDEASIRSLRDLAHRIAGDPQLQRDASATYHALFDTDTDISEAVRRTDHNLGADADVLHALFVLDSLRLVRERQASRGIPATIARAVNDRFGAAWLREAAGKGHIGLTYWDPNWLRTVASGHLVRLGRLEFVPTTWTYPFHIYTHERTGALVVLARAGQRFTDTGMLVGAATWEATLSETDNAIIGMPITPHGVALPQLVRLPLDEWQLALAAGDPVLDLHVPGEEALTIDAIRDALEQAEPFFGLFYPDHRFVAYVCDSWLFSPQLDALLGPESNIVRWQHEGYLMPSNNGVSDFLAFTFGSRAIDTTTAPRDTRLRRAVITHLEQGGTLCCGRYLLLRRDLGRFGAQPYREASGQAIAQIMVRT